MLKIGPKGTWWELVSVVVLLSHITLSSGSYGEDIGSKASPSPIADATGEGLMLSGFVRRTEEGYLASSLGWMKNFSMPMNVPWVIWRELERTKP